MSLIGIDIDSIDAVMARLRDSERPAFRSPRYEVLITLPEGWPLLVLTLCEAIGEAAQAQQRDSMR